jgi:hypothetical protein
MTMSKTQTVNSVVAEIPTLLGHDYDHHNVTHRLANQCWGIAERMLLTANKITTKPEDMPDAHNGLIVGICNFAINLDATEFNFKLSDNITGTKAVLLIKENQRSWQSSDDIRHSLIPWGPESEDPVDPKLIKVGIEIQVGPDWKFRLVDHK